MQQAPPSTLITGQLSQVLVQQARMLCNLDTLCVKELKKQRNMILRTTINILLLLISAVTIFHLGIILKIIPYEITWGGRLKNDTEMYMFEIVSILINLFLIITLLIKGAYIRQIFSSRIVNIILWAFFMLFGLNTVGNLFAKTNLEKLFAVLTLACSILIWIILKANNNKHTTMYKRN